MCLGSQPPHFTPRLAAEYTSLPVHWLLSQKFGSLSEVITVEVPLLIAHNSNAVTSRNASTKAFSKLQQGSAAPK
ncbi:hypothetical protein K5Q02_03740 [Pseudomonas sp. MM211]|uniref:hypothetical protein n=1 Tax=Pseudomonas sp. MM211 TaxID=2866808 RepID=UPI001CEC0594|nr:hypothetical protein [Pseudomonas sp. MM211]UCJ17502.1 hypothetical protein K5Q02_03740 [Pseudomonas sp. MM211]